CDITQVVLDGSQSSQGPNIAYEWTDSNGNPIGQDITVTVSSPGSYFLQVTDLDNGCSAPLDEVVVGENTEEPIAIIFADPNNILDCTVNSILLYSIEQDDVTYTWTSSAGSVTAPEIIVFEPGTYTLIAIDTITGCDNSDFIIVEEFQDYPFVELEPADTLNCYHPEITISGAGSQTGTNIIYNWYFGTDLIVGENDSTLLVDEEGFYYLQLIDTINGCQNIDSVYVESLLDQLPVAAIDQIGALDCNSSSLT